MLFLPNSSVLESHHAAMGFKLTIDPNSDNVNILKNLDRETYLDVRQSIIDMVLATEMTKHFEHFTKFIHVFEHLSLSDEEAEEIHHGKVFKEEILRNSENITLIKRMLIKCADISNPARVLKLCKLWAERIAIEYCDQVGNNIGFKL